MKKLIILISIFLVSFLSATTEKEAINLYKTKQYKKAYEAFLNLLEKNNYQSNNLNFYFAKSAEQIGNYKEALAAIERILIVLPNENLALYERARLYFLMKNYSISKIYFQEVLKQTKTPKIRQIIQKYLDIIAKKEKKSSLEFIAMLKFGYESNINNTSEIDKYDLFLGDSKIEITNNQKIEDSYTSEQLFANSYKHKFENFLFDNVLLILAKQYFSDHDKDFQYFKESPSIKTNFKKLIFTTKLNYGYLVYEDIHYLSIYGIEENIYYPINKGFLNQLTLKIDNKIYTRNENKNKNATLYSLNNKISKKLNKHLVSILVGFEKNIKHYDELDTINYNKYKTKIKDKYKFSSYTFDTYFQYENIKYNDKYLLFNKKQHDKKTIFAMKLTKKFNSFELETEYKYTQNNSNIAPFDYDKWNFSINILKSIKGF